VLAQPLALFRIKLKKGFVYTAYGAYPIIRNIRKGGAWSNSTIGIADFGIIHITARYTDPFFP